jgi:preprotein translocase SecE subunit
VGGWQKALERLGNARNKRETMVVKEDIKRDTAEGAPEGQPEADVSSEPSPEASVAGLAGDDGDLASRVAEGDDGDEGVVASPSQLGTQRWVYAAYFAGAIGIAFLFSKIIDFAWIRLQTLKPALGEPRDEIVMPLAGLVGAGTAVYFWFRTRARQLMEEVTAEMAKVTWPTKNEVYSGTVVCIVTTIVSTVFFALMDKFWGFFTNLVYGGS